MILVEAEIVCDSCGKNQNMKVPFKANIGFDVGDDWFVHGYTTFVQCRPCFELTDLKFKEAKKNSSFFKRFFIGGRWWYEFAKGHWAYKGI